MQKFFFIVATVMSFSYVTAQEVPNFSNLTAASPATEQSIKANSVNMSTGLPNIGIPLFSYRGNYDNLSLNVSLNYSGGAIRVSEQATAVGLGWNLSAGGSVSRIVRGMPDDIPAYGYLYSSAIPDDYRTDARKYYHDSIDAQLDIFQYSCPGGSGKFVIGKNNQLVTIPESKVRIIPAFYSGGAMDQMLKSFRVVFEDGTKYDFEVAETISVGASSSFPSGYAGKSYHSTWHLNRIVDAFYNDTIRIYYTARSFLSSSNFPQVTFVKDSDGSRTTPGISSANSSYTVQRIDSITFPNKVKVLFQYSNSKKYNDDDYALTNVKIKDSIFRFGYLLDYIDSIPYGHSIYTEGKKRLLLTSLTAYTAKEKYSPYKFEYLSPLMLPININDSVGNKVDHWGYFNNAINGTNRIPQVDNYTWGANRSASSYVYANALSELTFPSGAKVNYHYSPNYRYPYTIVDSTIIINPPTISQNQIILDQVWGDKNELVFSIATSTERDGAAPISGSGNLICYIKSSDGLTTYGTKTVSLYSLFYQGGHSWRFNLPDGAYRLDTEVSSGTTFFGSFPIQVKWSRRVDDTTANGIVTGGIRIGQVIKYNAPSEYQLTVVDQYEYVLESGKSSGYYGEVPLYHYDYSEKYPTQYGTSAEFTIVNSEPYTDLLQVNGNVVGYSRIVLSRIDILGKSLGKEVYEFTSPSEGNISMQNSRFPYVPSEDRSWALGLPKRNLVYDSLGNLLRKTIYSYSIDTTRYESDNFKSIKLGHTLTSYYGDPANSSTPRTKTFIGQIYYPVTGRLQMASSVDTIYHNDQTYNASYQNLTYDSNYNVTKVITSYDKTRGLELEKRIYYPYNYSVGGAIGKLKDSLIFTPVATEEWITGDLNTRIIGGSISKFKELSSGHIKIDTVFSLKTNKPISQATLGQFDSTKLNRNYTYFRPVMTVNEYNSNGSIVESTLLPSGIKSTVILDYSEQLPVAKIINAAKSDVAYTGFESDGTGYWTIAGNSRNSATAYSGARCYDLAAGNITKTNLSAGKSYYISLWSRSSNSVYVNGSLLTTGLSIHRNWTLYAITLSNVTSITISGTGLIDELRLHPIDASMTTSTYEPHLGPTFEVNPGNSLVQYQYDNLHRLKVIRDQDSNIIKRFDHSDTSMPISLSPSWQGYGAQCSGFNYDSLYIDVNPFSDSSGMSKAVFKRVDYCVCGHAQYRVVNGQCEQGVKMVTSSTYMQVYLESCDCYAWKWRCTYYYRWSDTHESDTYTEYQDSNCDVEGEQ